jgi:hypothetical protein
VLLFTIFLRLLLTFRGFASVAMPTNCVLSAKIKEFREEISTTQEKTSNSAKPAVSGLVLY